MNFLNFNQMLVVSNIVVPNLTIIKLELYSESVFFTLLNSPYLI